MNMSKQRTCVTCAHGKQVYFGRGAYNHQCHRCPGIDPVTGNSREFFMCGLERSNPDRCGWKGRWWEAKETEDHTP